MGNEQSGKTVSVVLALFNGERYLEDQLNSILLQLREGDELVIVDDGSTDGSIRIVEKAVEKYPGIRLIQGDHVGVNANFFRGIREAKGDIICLSDQDDIWYRTKLEKIRETLAAEETPVVLMHDARIVSAAMEDEGQTMFGWRPYRSGVFRNWWKNSYTGCRMAFNRAIKEMVTDAPVDIPMYDQWIGLMAEKIGKTVILEDILMDYRRHKGNVTDLKHRSLPKMMKDRIRLLIRYIQYSPRR